jgi:hypothetical protein
MDMAKVNQIAGFSQLAGARNPRIIESATPPINPKEKDIWIDLNDDVQYRRTGDQWVPINFVNQFDDSGLKVWVGLQADYDDIVTKDPRCLYFIKSE